MGGSEKSGGETEEPDTGSGSIEFAHAEAPPEIDGAETVVHGLIGVDPDGMLGVDAMLILEPLADAFEGLVTAPARDAIEEGEYDGTFDVFVPDASPESLAELLDGIGAVEKREVTRIDAGDDADTGADSPSGNSDGPTKPQGTPIGPTKAIETTARTAVDRRALRPRPAGTKSRRPGRRRPPRRAPQPRRTARDGPDHDPAGDRGRRHRDGGNEPQRLR